MENLQSQLENAMREHESNLELKLAEANRLYGLQLAEKEKVVEQLQVAMQEMGQTTQILQVEETVIISRDEISTQTEFEVVKVEQIQGIDSST